MLALPQEKPGALAHLPEGYRKRAELERLIGVRLLVAHNWAAL